MSRQAAIAWEHKLKADHLIQYADALECGICGMSEEAVMHKDAEGHDYRHPFTPPLHESHREVLEGLVQGWRNYANAGKSSMKEEAVYDSCSDELEATLQRLSRTMP